MRLRLVDVSCTIEPKHACSCTGCWVKHYGHALPIVMQLVADMDKRMVCTHMYVLLVLVKSYVLC